MHGSIIGYRPLWRFILAMVLRNDRWWSLGTLTLIDIVTCEWVLEWHSFTHLWRHNIIGGYYETLKIHNIGTSHPAWPAVPSAHELTTNVTDDQIMEQLQANDSVELAPILSPWTLLESLEAAMKLITRLLMWRKPILMVKSGVSLHSDKHQIAEVVPALLCSQLASFIASFPVSNLSNIATGALEYQISTLTRIFSLKFDRWRRSESSNSAIAIFDIELENVQYTV